MRESGILMHITSLPNPYGIGTMGKCAYDFLDFLSKAGQAYWQILPVNPTGYGDSPYQAFSTCAGNHYLIDLDFLVQEGLLTKQEIEAAFWGDDANRVDYGALYNNRLMVLKKAYERFVPDEQYHRFVEENDSWLADYCLFMVLKESYGGACWLQWPEELKRHQENALADKRKELADKIGLHQFLQYQFYRQWQALRDYAKGKDIRIIGDVPIYVPLDSVDVWANPDLFQLDEDRYPVKVAGCPPDAFTADGQLWGNPVYDWPKIAQTGYGWWIHRLQAAERMYDVIRIDHFRGFESYWAVPAQDKTAANGCWEKGPGMDFFRVIQSAMPEFAFIAEDLGYVTQEVRQLVEDSGYPGMKVIQFAFDSREESDYLPHTYPVNSVCYSGTHDNTTLQQWFDEAAPQDVEYAKRYLGLNQEEGYVWGMIRGAMSTVSRLCVVQIQDYLGLGKEGRMNQPGSLSMANWTWRAKSGFATDALADKIYRLTELYGRLKV